MRVDAVHLGLSPVRLAGTSIADDPPEDVVSVPEDVGGHGDHVPDAALGRIPPVVDGRLGVLNHDAQDLVLGSPSYGALLCFCRGRGHEGKVSTEPYSVNP
jgi:hypothetical protein